MSRSPHVGCARMSQPHDSQTVSVPKTHQTGQPQGQAARKNVSLRFTSVRLDKSGTRKYRRAGIEHVLQAIPGGDGVLLVAVLLLKKSVCRSRRELAQLKRSELAQRRETALAALAEAEQEDERGECCAGQRSKRQHVRGHARAAILTRLDTDGAGETFIDGRRCRARRR